MEDGRIVEQGTHEQLMRERGVYHEVVVRQMEVDSDPMHGETTLV